MTNYLIIITAVGLWIVVADRAKAIYDRGATRLGARFMRSAFAGVSMLALWPVGKHLEPAAVPAIETVALGEALGVVAPAMNVWHSDPNCSHIHDVANFASGRDAEQQGKLPCPFCSTASISKSAIQEPPRQLPTRRQ